VRAITTGHTDTDGNSRLAAQGGDEGSVTLAALAPQAQVEVVEDLIAGCYEELLGVSIVDRRQPVLLGSLEAVELNTKLEILLGIALPLQELFEGVSITDLAREATEALGAREGDTSNEVRANVEGKPAERYDPFPLTAIQQAYLIGRQSLFELGGVSTHFYTEAQSSDVDVQRLQLALQRLIARHDALRTIFLADGRQRIIENVPAYEIDTNDLRGERSQVATEKLQRVRQEMSHQVLPADRWPLFDVRASLRPDGATVIHFSIDLLIADAQSIGLMLYEWAQLYEDPAAELPEIGVTFRDYVLAAEKLKDSAAYQAARSYWIDRLHVLAPPPELPLAIQPSQSDGRRARRQHHLDRGTWARLKERANTAQVTASTLLCAAYAEVLATWSAFPGFTVNVTLGSRLPLHPDIGLVIGDFTSSILLEVKADDGATTFKDRVRQLQQQFYRDLSHKLFPGVEMQRELARANGIAAATMPIVFTSLLGMPFPENAEHSTFPMELGYGISQTPQVHLDHVVYERDGELHFTWDAVEDLFPPGVLDEMFDAYCQLLERLAGSQMAFVERRPCRLPADQAQRRSAVNQTRFAQDPARMIHSLVDERCEQAGERPAVIAADRTLSYAELDRLANRVADVITDSGAQPDQLIGVLAEKGWEQVVAVLGIARSGAAYLPIDPRLPEARLRFLLDHGEVNTVLTQRHVREQMAWPAGIHPINIDGPEVRAASEAPVACAAAPENLAYVIFTSGSTGVPKGVMIEHRAVANTLADCVDRYRLTATDRVLAVSSLSFDLSVFDIFGVLAAGGAIVIPEQEEVRDPARLAQLAAEHRVTVWNSVPALFDVLVTYLSSDGKAIEHSLRLAMLSGDWIPVELPSRARAVFPGIELVSLGGATEASIWSIDYPIGEVPADWTSIPYGKAMANQQMYVLDRLLEPRPDWVPGEILIGGSGVARGYWRDPDRTEQSFVTHPGTRRRLYRTGDIGRYLPSGDIEFMGRRDSQVKVRGHRIELGEIEAALQKHPGVHAAVARVFGERTGAKRLVAYLVPVDGEQLDTEHVRAALAEQLPDYMIPSAVLPLEQLPLTANGKVDLKALPEPSWGAGENNDTADNATGQPQRDAEQLISTLMCEVLGLDEIGRNDSFSALGGDSLLAIRMVAKAGAQCLRIEPRAFFDGPATVATLAASATWQDAPIADQRIVTGEITLTPSQQWFLEQDFDEPHHWNGMWPLLSIAQRIDPAVMSSALRHLLLHHDMLRLRLRRDDGWQAFIAGPEAIDPPPFSVVDLSDVPEVELQIRVEETCTEMQESLDLIDGPLVRLTHIDLGPGKPGRLHVAAHWIALDYYSSRIFFEDLQTAYLQLSRGEEALLPPKTTAFPEFSAGLHAKAQTNELTRELSAWTCRGRANAPELPLDHLAGENRQASARRVGAVLGCEETRTVTQEITRLHDCEVREALLAAVGLAVCGWTTKDSLLVELEGHGRENLLDGVDVSRTIGRCSTLWPAYLKFSEGQTSAQALQAVRDSVRSCPNHGIGYGMLRYLSESPDTRRLLAEMPAAPIGLNHWGQVDEYFTDLIWPSTESPGPHRNPAGLRPRLIEITSFVANGQLVMLWSYSENLHLATTIQRLAEQTMRELGALAPADGRPFTVTPAVLVEESRPLQQDGEWQLPPSVEAVAEL
jgi:amino acid adenylation domain-containing protein/non-ribosomal peptide synthase protein (TIGR01720 family)